MTYKGKYIVQDKQRTYQQSVEWDTAVFMGNVVLILNNISKNKPRGWDVNSLLSSWYIFTELS